MWVLVGSLDKNGSRFGRSSLSLSVCVQFFFSFPYLDGLEEMCWRGAKCIVNFVSSAT